jgi:hypothetical protein
VSFPAKDGESPPIAKHAARNRRTYLGVYSTVHRFAGGGGLRGLVAYSSSRRARASHGRDFDASQATTEREANIE